jgi:tRNA_anti-like
MRRAAALLLLATAIAGAACADTLPDQDRRILTAAPAAKTTADILWKEYQDDRAGAERKYWGKAVEITGPVSRLLAATETSGPVLMFDQDQTLGVEAHLLDDQADEILKSIADKRRVTLRCFCEHFNRNVILKSCVKP